MHPYCICGDISDVPPYPQVNGRRKREGVKSLEELKNVTSMFFFIFPPPPKKKKSIELSMFSTLSSDIKSLKNCTCVKETKLFVKKIH